MTTKYYAFDAAPGLLKRDKGLAAVTADGIVGPQWDQGGAAATDAILLVNVEAIKISAGNETYTFTVIASNQADRSDGEVLGQFVTGNASEIAHETVDGAALDRGEVRFRTQKNDRDFRYVDLHLEVAGTGPSIAFSAYISKEM